MEKIKLEVGQVFYTKGPMKRYKVTELLAHTVGHAGKNVTIRDLGERGYIAVYSNKPTNEQVFIETGQLREAYEYQQLQSKVKNKISDMRTGTLTLDQLRRIYAIIHE